MNEKGEVVNTLRVQDIKIQETSKILKKMRTAPEET